MYRSLDQNCVPKMYPLFLPSLCTSPVCLCLGFISLFPYCIHRCSIRWTTGMGRLSGTCCGMATLQSWRHLPNFLAGKGEEPWTQKTQTHTTSFLNYSASYADKCTLHGFEWGAKLPNFIFTKLCLYIFKRAFKIKLIFYILWQNTFLNLSQYKLTMFLKNDKLKEFLSESSSCPSTFNLKYI